MYPSYSYTKTTYNSSIPSFGCSLTSDDDNDKTVRTSNLSDIQDINVTHGMLDSGTADHFLALNSKVESTWPSTNKIKVVIPNGDHMLSSCECNIDWPILPKEAQTGHFLPSLKTHALISVVKLCNAGCDVLFRHNCCLVIYKNKVIMYGVQCPRTCLLMVPLSIRNQQKPMKRDKNCFNKHHANSIHHMAN